MSKNTSFVKLAEEVRGMPWYDKWDPSNDLARGGVELSFRKPEDMGQLLVVTGAIKSVENIVSRMGTKGTSPRYHVIGTRGLGKSTILNYFVYLLHNRIQSEKALPVYVTLLGAAKDDKDMEFIFFRSLLESLFDVPSDLDPYDANETFSEPMQRLRDAEKEYTGSLEQFGKVGFEFITAAFEKQLGHLREYFDKVVFLIDGLDKQDSEVVLKFLHNTQERLNNIIDKHNCVFIDAADPSWREPLETTEFSGVRGVSISLRGLTVKEIEDLIKKRLQNVGVIIMPFDTKALEILVEQFQGNPREILQYATTVLHNSAKQQVKTIGSGVIRGIIWSDEAKAKFIDSIRTDPDMRYAYWKIKDFYKDRQKINMLMAAYSAPNQVLSLRLKYEERSSMGITLSDEKFRNYVEILVDRGCIRRAKLKHLLKLENDLLKLFDFITKINQPLAALPIILGELDSGVIDVPVIPPEEVLMKTEIRNVFDQHPSEWLDYNKVKQILFENPRTAQLLQERFREDCERKVTSTIPLIVSQLMEEEKLMRDEATKSYRLLPSTVEYEIAQLLKSKELLNRIDLAAQALASKDTTNLKKYCVEILKFSISSIDDILGNRIDLTKNDETIRLLETLGVNIEKPVPLAFFLAHLGEHIDDTSEAKVVLDTSILYAKRIFAKINEITQYEERNKELIIKLEGCKVGVAKENERRDFNATFLPILLSDYGKLVNCMNEIKMVNGFTVSVPAELDALKQSRHLLPAKIFKCSKCGAEIPVSAEKVETMTCPNDRIPMVCCKSGYMLSERAYQIWNVWMEEYVRSILESLLCRYVRSGLTLRCSSSTGVTTPEEVDVAVVHNGRLLAVECVQVLSFKEEKNDITNIVSKVEGLGLFDSIIIAYQSVDDSHAFQSTVGRFGNVLRAVRVDGPRKFKDGLQEALVSIQGSPKKQDKLAIRHALGLTRQNASDR